MQVGPVSMAGTKVTMESPKLSGFKKDGKAYEVFARQAVQDIKTPTIVELNNLTSRLEQENKKFARLSADWGASTNRPTISTSRATCACARTTATRPISSRPRSM